MGVVAGVSDLTDVTVVLVLEGMGATSSMTWFGLDGLSETVLSTVCFDSPSINGDGIE